MADQSASNVKEEESRPASSVDAKRMGDSLAAFYQPALDDNREHVQELLTAQSRLNSAVQQENERLKECWFTYNIPDLMQQIRTYHRKLNGIKKNMTLMHERSAKLKRRSLRLKEVMESRAERARQERLNAQRREEQLVARFTGPAPENPPAAGQEPQ